MQLLVTGAGGLLGGNIVRTASSAGWSVIGTYHTQKPAIKATCEQLDITDTQRFEELLLRYTPETVINCAAMTDVDACEDNPEQARSVNGVVPGEMARIADEHGVGFVQISTDYVFDGEKDGRYEPDDTPNPVQAYGESKLYGERTVKETHSDPWIVRLSFVYGRDLQGDLEGFPAWVLGRLESDELTPVFVDQYITPTRAGSAAETILDLVQTQGGKTVHVAARDCITPYEFGVTLAEITGHSTELLEEGSMADIDRAAERPKNTCLFIKEVESILGRSQPTVEADLRALTQSIR